jgi:hypothetical protein
LAALRRLTRAYGDHHFRSRSALHCCTSRPIVFRRLQGQSSLQLAEEVRYEALTAQLADNRQALLELEAQERYQRGQVGLVPVLEDQEQLYAIQDAKMIST